MQELRPWDNPLSDAAFLKATVGKKADEWDEWDARKNGHYAVTPSSRGPLHD